MTCRFTGHLAVSKQQISDAEILKLIEAGIIKRDGDSIVKFHGAWKRYVTLTPTRHDTSGRYRYKIHLGGYAYVQYRNGRRRCKGTHRERLIYRNKLFWMIEHRRLPNGYCHLDHVDHDNTNDAPENLAERDPLENCADNYSKAHLDAILAFFDNPEGQNEPKDR